MSKFITSSNLDNEIESIIREAKTKLLLISPYINLSDNIKNLLLQKTSHPELEIIIAFREEWKEGKNGGDNSAETESKYKNLKELDIWKNFPNIRLVGLNNLHAKYYANENKGVITSLNLYRYSIKNNIEYGCLIRGNTYLETTNYSERIIEDWGNVIYAKVPRYRVIKGEKRYVDSVELCNFIYDNPIITKADKSKYSIEAVRVKYENAYMPWSQENDNYLIKLYEEGKSVEELSIIFKRTNDAIKSRLRKYGKH